MKVKMQKAQFDLFGKEDIDIMHELNRKKQIKNSKAVDSPKSQKGLTLLRNVQFIYELTLARKELQSFGCDFEVSNDYRLFELRANIDIEYVKKRLAYFESINGVYTDYYHMQKYNQTSSVNQYLTHWIYPYKGKFHPQMIRALLNIMQLKEGEVVLDPFLGSGTAAVECQLLGIDFVGVDISLLCCLLSRVKTESMDVVNEIIKAKQDVNFDPKKINNLKNEKVKNFYRIAEMIAYSDSVRRRRNFSYSFQANIEKMVKSIKDYEEVRRKFNLKLGKTKIIKADVRKLNLDNNSIDGIITSPPYSIALNYVQNDAHSLAALGYDLKKISEDFIGVRGSGFNKFKLYDEDMAIALKQMYRVLKKGKYCTIIIGNVTYQGQEVDTTQMVIDCCLQVGFSLVKKMEKIIFGLYNVMQKEYILIFRKD